MTKTKWDLFTGSCSYILAIVYIFSHKPIIAGVWFIAGTVHIAKYFLEKEIIVL